MNFSTLPPEIQFDYLLKLSPNEVLKYCETSQAANAICQDPFFWEKKSELDLGVPISAIDQLTPYQKYRFIQALDLSPALYGPLVRAGNEKDFLKRTIQERDYDELVGTIIKTDDLQALKTLAFPDDLKDWIRYALLFDAERIIEYLNSIEPTHLQDLNFLDELAEIGVSITPYLQDLVDTYGREQLLSVAIDERLPHVEELLKIE